MFNFHSSREIPILRKIQKGALARSDPAGTTKVIRGQIHIRSLNLERKRPAYIGTGIQSNFRGKLILEGKLRRKITMNKECPLA